MSGDLHEEQVLQNHISIDTESAECIRTSSAIEKVLNATNAHGLLGHAASPNTRS